MIITAVIYVMLQVAFIGAIDPQLLAQKGGMVLVILRHLRILQFYLE